jgi:1-acyl-sn-glycerol-3-phosphate acyltransferase
MAGTPERGDWFYRLARSFVRYCVFTPLGGFRVEGLANVPLQGPLIVAANHVSFADPPAIGCAMPRPVRFMAQAGLFKPPIFGPTIRKLGAFPVHRGEADKAAIRHALELLDQGWALLVFPEGRRGDGQRLGPANRGVELLAKRSGAPVLPAGILGTARWLPKGAKIPRPTRITVRFGEPFAWDASFNFDERLMMEISALCEVPYTPKSL